MRLRLCAGWLAMGLLLAAASPPSGAHHSVAGQFDLEKTLTLVGVVAEIDWINPHIYVFLDVPDADGKITTWRLATVPTAMARKAGLTKAMLMGDGETVTVTAHPARDGTRQLGWIVKIAYPDGHFYQFAEDNAPTAGR